MKCDRRWWNDGQYARACKAYEDWRAVWTGFREYRNADGRVVAMRIGGGFVLHAEPVGYDANGSPVHQEISVGSV
jgi:hypothetical protein